MKRLLFLFLLIPVICHAAELLVRAKPHWMDSFTQEDIDKMTKNEKQSYDARTQIGDIIVVRPDGWAWGKEECLPNFVVVKLPGVAVEDVKNYEETLQDTTDPERPILLKRRKHQIPKAVVDGYKLAGKNAVTIQSASIQTYKDAVIVKTK